MAEFSIKKDPSDDYPSATGSCSPPARMPRRTTRWASSGARTTPSQEAYGSSKIPIGSGLTIKGGKFVTLLGYEVIESPNNLNFSRSFMFSFAIPLTHVGGLVS